jgi:hypothetical protein
MNDISLSPALNVLFGFKSNRTSSIRYVRLLYRVNTPVPIIFLLNAVLISGTRDRVPLIVEYCKQYRKFRNA